MNRFIVAAIMTVMMATGAMAADLKGLKDGRDGSDIFSAPSAATWTGAYVGAHAGYAWGDATTRDDPSDWETSDPKYIGPFPFDLDGAVAGVTLGYNFQRSRIVFGPEIEIGYMGINGSRRTDSSNPTKHQTLAVDAGLYALLGGRVGVAFDRTLVYAKGGWIWWGTDATQVTTNPGFVTHGTGAYSGLAYGGGVEQILAGGWSVKAEYMHLDFGDKGGDQTGIEDGHVFGNRTSVDADTVKIGVNYKFGSR